MIKIKIESSVALVFRKRFFLIHEQNLSILISSYDLKIFLQISNFITDDVTQSRKSMEC